MTREEGQWKCDPITAVSRILLALTIENEYHNVYWYFGWEMGELRATKKKGKSNVAFVGMHTSCSVNTLNTELVTGLI